jgi:hypothetical protein
MVWWALHRNPIPIIGGWNLARWIKRHVARDRHGWIGGDTERLITRNVDHRVSWSSIGRDKRFIVAREHCVCHRSLLS